MTMMMIVGMAVIMIMVAMAAMIRRAHVPAGVIGAAFRIERRIDLDNARAEATHHFRDHVIAANTQRLRHDLGRQMTVAEMPCDTDEMQGVIAADLDQRFGSGNHFDQTAVVEHQRVASAQYDRLFQIEHKRKPARSRHRHTPAITIIEIEHDRIGGGLLPLMLPDDFGRAAHIVIPDFT